MQGGCLHTPAATRQRAADRGQIRWRRPRLCCASTRDAGRPTSEPPREYGGRDKSCAASHRAVEHSRSKASSLIRSNVAGRSSFDRWACWKQFGYAGAQALTATATPPRQQWANIGDHHTNDRNRGFSGPASPCPLDQPPSGPCFLLWLLAGRQTCFVLHCRLPTCNLLQDPRLSGIGLSLRASQRSTMAHAGVPAAALAISFNR